MGSPYVVHPSTQVIKDPNGRTARSLQASPTKREMDQKILNKRRGGQCLSNLQYGVFYQHLLTTGPFVPETGPGTNDQHG